MKALPIEVYKHRSGSCSNGGITGKYDTLLLVCDEGFIDVDEDNPPENLVIFVNREVFGKHAPYIRPYADPEPGRVGWMASGCFAWACDSRFRRLYGFDGAISIHDRQE